LLWQARVESNEKPALLLKEITGIAIGAFFGTYNELAGFPEFVVCRGTAIALRDAGLIVREEVSLPVWFRGRQIVNFKADMVVDPGLIIEVKATPEIQPFHKTQLKNYLKATGLEVGFSSISVGARNSPASSTRAFASAHRQRSRRT